MTTTCANCPRTLIPQRAWADATEARRGVWIAEGKSVHQAHGLCRGCYLRLWKAGGIEHTRPGVGGRGNVRTDAPGHSHSCVRCGITTRYTMCRDCKSVAA